MEKGLSLITPNDAAPVGGMSGPGELQVIALLKKKQGEEFVNLQGKKMAFFAALCAFLAPIQAGAYSSLTAKEVLSQVHSETKPDNTIFFDVREGQRSYIIPGTVAIPVSKLKEACSPDNKESPCLKIRENKDATLVVYCDQGVASRKASKILASMGIEKFINLKDGLQGWINEGGRVIQNFVYAPVWMGGTCDVNVPD